MMTNVRNAILPMLAALLGVAVVGCGVGNAQGDLRTAVDAEQSSMNECYRVALERDESTAGTMHLRLHMDRSTTTVREVEVMDSDLGDSTLESCVTNAIQGVSITDAPGGNMAVDYTVRFSPSES